MKKARILRHAFLVFPLLIAGCAPESHTTGQSDPASSSKHSQTQTAALDPKSQEPAAPQGDSPMASVAVNPATPMPVAAEPPTRSTPRREEEEEEPMSPREEKEVPPESPPPIPDSFKPLNKEKNLFFEKTADNTRRVHILAEVCLREGPLEVFMCKKNTKEHESILNVDMDIREIHLALIAAGAKPGSTVRWVPKYKPATGSTIKVTLTYNMNGKLMTKPAQYWVADTRTKKDMSHDWVFAGSRFFKDPDDATKAPYYCANNGEVICISNFPDSMMDLPVMSSKEQAELGFAANTERIPPLKTKVLVTLEVKK